MSTSYSKALTCWEYTRVYSPNTTTAVICLPGTGADVLGNAGRLTWVKRVARDGGYRVVGFNRTQGKTGQDELAAGEEALANERCPLVPFALDVLNVVGHLIDSGKARQTDDGTHAIAIVGDCMGGALAVLAAAADERIRAVCVDGGLRSLAIQAQNLRQASAQGHNQLLQKFLSYSTFPEMVQAGIDWPEVAALIAPRPLNVFFAKSDPSFGVQSGADEACRFVSRVYALGHAQERLFKELREGEKSGIEAHVGGAEVSHVLARLRDFERLSTGAPPTPGC